MRIRHHLGKEVLQLGRDRVGLVLVFLAPVLMIAIYRGLGSKPLDAAATAPDSTPIALVLVLSSWLPNLTMGSTILQRERSSGTLDRLRATPFDPWAYVLAKALFLAGLAIVQGSLVWLAARALVDRELPPGHDHQGMAALVALAFAAGALGLLLAVLLSSATQLANATSILTLASLTFSGFFRPLDELGGAGWLAGRLPFALGYTNANALVRGTSFEWVDVGLLVGGGFAFCCVAALLLPSGAALRLRVGAARASRE